MNTETWTHCAKIQNFRTKPQVCHLINFHSLNYFAFAVIKYLEWDFLIRKVHCYPTILRNHHQFSIRCHFDCLLDPKGLFSQCSTPNLCLIRRRCYLHTHKALKVPSGHSKSLRDHFLELSLYPKARKYICLLCYEAQTDLRLVQ